MSLGRLAVVSMIILTVFVIALVLIAFINPLPGGFFRSGTVFANISGFIAIFLIGASGGMMFFRTSVLKSTRNADAFREVHVLLAALGGLFLIFHVAFFLLFPLSLPVLIGYIGTYV